MINSLATALGVAVLSMNAPTTTTTHEEPTRAYYDASQVADYGNTNGYLYNYTGHEWQDDNEQTNEGSTNIPTFAFIGGTDTFVAGFIDENENGYTLYYLEDYTGEVDIYINGVFSVTATPTNNRYPEIVLPSTITEEDQNDYYIWVFEHQEPTITENIFEVVGDTITEGAGVIGNGFASLVGIFWDGSSLTGMGILSLITLGISIVWFSFSYVTGLIRKR